MAKSVYLITKEATKYWKRCTKSGRLSVAVKDDKIYIVTEATAVIIPADKSIWAYLVSPAIGYNMPENNRAYHWDNGSMIITAADDTVRLVDNILNEATGPAKRTRFTAEIDSKKKVFGRIYKTACGLPGVVDEALESMVDFRMMHEINMAKPISPAIITGLNMTAVIMPIRSDWLCATLEDLIA